MLPSLPYQSMRFSDYIAGIFDVFAALLQSSLRVIVLAESVRHAAVALDRRGSTGSQRQLAALVACISTKVVVCHDDVSS